jgi:hypothetical protein
MAEIKLNELENANSQKLIDLKAEAEAGDITAFRSLQVRGGHCCWRRTN